MQLTLKIYCNHVFSNAALTLNVHYQLELTYDPVHLSLYVAEQGARFLWTQSQMCLQCSRSPRSAPQLHIAPNQLQHLTHLFLVFKRQESNQEMTCHFNRRLFFSYSLNPLPLLVYCSLSVDMREASIWNFPQQQWWIGTVFMLSKFDTIKRCCRRNSNSLEFSFWNMCHWVSWMSKQTKLWWVYITFWMQWMLYYKENCISN